MSFQDVGVGGTKRARPQGGAARLESYRGMPPVAEELGASAVDGDPSSASGSAYAQVSDGIVQFRRNIGILEKIVSQFGTRDDGPMLQKQYATQLDVVRQLGERINGQLRRAEEEMRTMSRTEREKSRATHAKLTRDYRRVEQAFKSVQLEVRRKRGLAEARRRELEEEAERRRLEGEGAGNELLQAQLQEDRLAEEIMREREEEIQNINKGMHTVNEIYKDLAHIVGSQQEQIDQVETHMEDAKENTEAGLKQVEKANEKADSPYQCVIS